MPGVVPTWLPPIPWQGYMISGFPPWLFSPTSRQLLVPSFLICKAGKRGAGALGGTLGGRSAL